MLLKKLMADVEARAGLTRLFQVVLGASLLTNILLAGVLLTMDRTVRTILAPPEINKTFWVDGRQLGPEYLEQMGAWIIQQYATVSPATVDYQNNLLLRYVHPSIHGDLAVRFQIGANRIKSENMSRVFMPREVRISEQGQSVAFIGALSTWIADKRVPADEIKAYLVTFDYDGSRTFIKELRETNAISPFDPPSAKQVSQIEAEEAERQRAAQIAAPAPQTSVAPDGAALPPPPAAMPQPVAPIDP